MPPSVSISGLERLATRASLFDSCSTLRDVVVEPRRMTSSSVNALTMRMPCTVSCMVSRMRVPPVNWLRGDGADAADQLAQHEQRRRHDHEADQRHASGPASTITATRPTSESRSRPTAVTSRLMTWLAAVGAGGQPRDEFGRVAVGEERRPSLSSLSNMRRWLSATMRLPIRVRMHGLAVSRRALTVNSIAVTSRARRSPAGSG